MTGLATDGLYYYSGAPTTRGRVAPGWLSTLKRTLPQSKTYVTSKPPVGDISVVTLIRTDTTLDHSQEAEKVWASWLCRSMYVDLFSYNTLL